MNTIDPQIKKLLAMLLYSAYNDLTASLRWVNAGRPVKKGATRNMVYNDRQRQFKHAILFFFDDEYVTDYYGPAKDIIEFFYPIKPIREGLRKEIRRNVGGAGAEIFFSALKEIDEENKKIVTWREKSLILKSRRTQ